MRYLKSKMLKNESLNTRALTKSRNMKPELKKLGTCNQGHTKLSYLKPQLPKNEAPEIRAIK